MKIIEEVKQVIKDRMDYTESDIGTFINYQRNQEILSKSLKLLGKTIVIEVIESHRCNSMHKVGDKFYFDGAGNLLTKLCPKRICVYALAELDKLIFAANELVYAGIDPNELRFKRTSCFDVGLKCGGWGQIVMEMKIIDRKTNQPTN